MILILILLKRSSFLPFGKSFAYTGEKLTQLFCAEKDYLKNKNANDEIF